ncbi:MAG: hypothetical protein LBU64_14590 [Planctomycetota bacterium]|jgi:hypothetical protein|nr:hypothetical protein [Planctomycetota bacterium]
MAIDYDYASYMNQFRLDSVNAIMGDKAKIAGMDASLIQQWSMLGSNSAAYRRLLEAQKTGELRQNAGYEEIASDKYLNDNYDPDAKVYLNPGYSPQTPEAPAVDLAEEAGETLDSLRRLALAAIGQPESLNQTHYDIFNGLRGEIAANLVSPDAEAESLSPAQFGQVELGGRTYSFADLATGGSASLANNPDAALAVLDQAIQDVYQNRAAIRGFDPAAHPLAPTS